MPIPRSTYPGFSHHLEILTSVEMAAATVGEDPQWKEIGRRKFYESFNQKAKDWAYRIAQEKGYRRWVADRSLAGGYYVNEAGDCLRLK